MVVYPNAKINIGLFVTEKRPDGYHNLETVFYPYGERDRLELHRGRGKDGECRLEVEGIRLDCISEKNLVVQAYRLLSADHSLPAVEVKLKKKIPYGAGLGGGSSDAAFMLKALNDYFELRLTEADLIGYASRLGSDCAFFIRNKPAFATGRGEVLEEIGLSLDGYEIRVVKPDCNVSTREAYAKIKPLPASYDLRKLVSLPVEEWRNYVVNDFEQVVFPDYPEIEQVKAGLYEKGAVYASMTGSGAGVFGLYKSKDVCRK